MPLADVQHIELHPKNSAPGIVVITKHTTYDREGDGWNNSIWIGEPEATAFKAAWCRYRHELEFDTLADLTAPDALATLKYIADREGDSITGKLARAAYSKSVQN